jgi:hypothetical protein
MNVKKMQRGLFLVVHRLYYSYLSHLSGISLLAIL